MQKEVETTMSDEPESREDRVLNAVHAILVRDGRIKPTAEADLKQELVMILRAFVESGATVSNVVRTHERAEELLLEIVNDPEITTAWKEAADVWFYA